MTVPRGEVGWLSCIRKSGSFAPALKSKRGHLKVAATRCVIGTGGLRGEGRCVILGNRHIEILS